LYCFSSVAAGENAESSEKWLHSQANRTPNSHEEFIVILFRIIFSHHIADYLDQAVVKFQETAKNFDEFVKKADRKE